MAADFLSSLHPRKLLQIESGYTGYTASDLKSSIIWPSQVCSRKNLYFWRRVFVDGISMKHKSKSFRSYKRDTFGWTRHITWWSVGIRYVSSAMAIRLHFVLLLIVASAMAQTFQLSFPIDAANQLNNFLTSIKCCRYSRGWTNGRKRADSSFIQQQMLQHGRPIFPTEFQTSNSLEDWNRYRINNENKVNNETHHSCKLHDASDTRCFERQLNEDGDWLVHINQCAKLVTSLGSYLKNKDGKLSDDPIVNSIR